MNNGSADFEFLSGEDPNFRPVETACDLSDAELARLLEVIAMTDEYLTKRKAVLLFEAARRLSI